MKDYNRREVCRLCEDKNLKKIVNLPHTTIADYFSKKRDLVIEKYPIDLYLCGKCKHVQLADILNPEILFHNEYSYKPSYNEKLRLHFENYVDFVVEESNIIPRNCVDIGSNDGLFLEIVREKTNSQILGIDPAIEPAAEAERRGIKTIVSFFNKETTKYIKENIGKVDWISANNVFAHNDDLAGMLRLISEIIANNGIFTFEISYLLDIFEKGLIGTVFHEHLSYHSIYSLIPFLKKYDLELISVQRVQSQGGALIGIAGKNKSKQNSIVNELLEKEKQCGIDKINGIKDFEIKVNKSKRELQKIIIKEEIDSMVGFGAARSSNLMVEFYGLGKIIEFIVDDNKNKIGKFFPNYGIPINPTAFLKNQTVKYVIILAWIHTEQIIPKIKEINKEIKIITLYPSIEII